MCTGGRKICHCKNKSIELQLKNETDREHDFNCRFILKNQQEQAQSLLYLLEKLTDRTACHDTRKQAEVLPAQYLRNCKARLFSSEHRCGSKPLKRKKRRLHVSSAQLNKMARPLLYGGRYHKSCQHHQLAMDRQATAPKAVFTLSENVFWVGVLNGMARCHGKAKTTHRIPQAKTQHNSLKDIIDLDIRAEMLSHTNARKPDTGRKHEVSQSS